MSALAQKIVRDIIQQLRTFGDELKVLQPKELANQFRELGWKYTLMYPKE